MWWHGWQAPSDDERQIAHDGNISSTKRSGHAMARTAHGGSTSLVATLNAYRQPAATFRPDCCRPALWD